MTALREIFAEFGIQFDRRRALERGNRSVNRVRDGLQRLGPVVSGIRGQLVMFAAAIGGAAIVGGLSRFIRGIITLGDSFDKTAQQIGLSTRELQAWSHAAELSGVDSAAFANAMGQLQRNAHEANRGTATMVEAFDALGISVNNAAGELKSPNELMLEMADGLAGIDNSSQRTAIAMTILGRSGRRMLPLFAQGSDGARAMLTELEELGGGMSELSISESVKLNDEMTRLRLVFQSFKSAIAVDLLPKIRDVVTWFISVRSTVQGLIENTTVLRTVMIAGILAIVGALVATAPVWGSFALTILGVVVVAGVLALAIDEIWTTIQGGDSVIRRAGEAFGAYMWESLMGIEIVRDALVYLINLYSSLHAAGPSIVASFVSAGVAIGGVINGIIARVVALINVVQQAASVIASLGGGGSIARLGSAVSGVFGGSTAPSRPNQASIAQSPAAQLRVMQPTGGRQTVNNRVNAPATTTVHVTEAQDPAATARAVQGQIDTSWQRQLRQINAAQVPTANLASGTVR